MAEDGRTCGNCMLLRRIILDVILTCLTATAVTSRMILAGQTCQAACRFDYAVNWTHVATCSQLRAGGSAAEGSHVTSSAWHQWPAQVACLSELPLDFRCNFRPVEPSEMLGAGLLATGGCMVRTN